jgi:hypothetical protein
MGGSDESWVIDLVSDSGDKFYCKSAILRHLERKQRMSALIPSKSPPALKVSRKPPIGPPFLVGFPLYDGHDEKLHDVLNRLAIQLDEATGINVLIELVGNPSELYDLYNILRSSDLVRQDAIEMKARIKRLKSDNRSDSYDRRMEVHKLAEYLSVRPDQLPCIAFLSFPLSLPVGIFSVKKEWISTYEEQERFATALVEYFMSHFDIRLHLNRVPTNVELVKVFETDINRWIAKRLQQAATASNKLGNKRIPPKKRATRAIVIDALKGALKEHIMSAQDYARATRNSQGEAKLLKRPTQKEFAKQLGLGAYAVSRAINDSMAKDLKVLWNKAGDLEEVMKFRRG